MLFNDIMGQGLQPPGMAGDTSEVRPPAVARGMRSCGDRGEVFTAVIEAKDADGCLNPLPYALVSVGENAGDRPIRVADE